MNSENDDRDAYLFMAYLAQAATELGFDVPLTRDAYQVRSHIPAFGHQRVVETRLGLSSEVSMPVSAVLGSLKGWKRAERAAKNLVDDLKRLPLSIPDLTKAVLEQTARAEQAFAGLVARGLNVRLTSLDLVFDETRRNGEPYYSLAYEGLGIDARPTSSKKFIGDAEMLSTELEGLVQEQIVRAARARERDGAQALGAIDRVLLNRATRHGIEVATLFKSKSELEKGRIIPFPDGEVMIFWEDGILTGDVPFEDGISYFGGRIWMRPDANIGNENIRGRRVREIINHPDMPEDLLFTSEMSLDHGVPSTSAEVQYVLIPKSTHQIA